MNSICPSGIYDKKNNLNKIWDQNFKTKYKNRSLLNKFCTKEDVASATIFLSTRASNYITGVNLLVDGGWTAV